MVHSAQGKPGRSGKDQEKLKNLGKPGNLREISWKIKALGKTHGTFLHFFSTS